MERILVLSNSLELTHLEDEYKIVTEKLIDRTSRPTSDYDGPSIFTIHHLEKWACDYKAIIICNNNGAGEHRAKLIPLEMRKMTVITWSSNPSESMKAPYRELGFQHFTTQRQAENYLRTHLLQS